IAFVSNRFMEKDSLVKRIQLKEEKDIFVYELKSAQIRKVTNSPDISESYPIGLANKISYLAPQDRLQQRFVAEFDSSINRIDTIIHYDYFYKTSLEDSYSRSIMEQHSSSEHAFTEIIYKNRKYQLIYNKNQNRPISQEGENLDKKKTPEETIEKAGKLMKSYQTHLALKKKLDFSKYRFYTEKNKDSSIQKKVLSKKDTTVSELVFPTQRLYRLNFKPDNSTLQLNNTYLNRRYQNFNGGPYINAGFGAAARIGIVDLMEDYRIYGGFRYSG